jgi:hypothetical protein
MTGPLGGWGQRTNDHLFGPKPAGPRRRRGPASRPPGQDPPGPRGCPRVASSSLLLLRTSCCKNWCSSAAGSLAAHHGQGIGVAARVAAAQVEDGAWSRWASVIGCRWRLTTGVLFCAGQPGGEQGHAARFYPQPFFHRCQAGFDRLGRPGSRLRWPSPLASSCRQAGAGALC